MAVISYEADIASRNARINLQQNLFSFLIEGEKGVHYAGTHIKIQSQQFLLLSAGNCLMSEKIPAEGGKYRSILFFFDNKALTSFFTRYSYVLSNTDTSQSDEPVLVFDKDDFLANYIESLRSMLGKTISARMQQIKLDELMLYLSEHYPGQIQRLSAMNIASDDLLIRQAVTAHIDQQVTVEELAFLCNMSRSTFKRRFARIYGTSPNKWMLEKRMQKAATLLRQSACKVSDVYVALGYENLSSFIQSFKQVYGVTPKQYQRIN